MFHDKKWLCGHADSKKTNQLAKALNITNTLAAVLVVRGIETVEDAERFLYPNISQLADPFLMPDMEVSVERIIRALELKERICIYGDYDVDGITSVSIMLNMLRAVGADVIFYVPDRMDEGYGLNSRAVEDIHEKGARLLITVDCGTTSFEEIELCNRLGMDVIVTDHHQCRQQLPPALGVINPKREDCKYPCSELAGVGVVYKLCTALEQRMRGSRANGPQQVVPAAGDMLDLAALGTVADIVPLTGENRVLVHEGLKRMENTLNPGLRALIKVSGIRDGRINTGQVAFMLAPRLNASGRLSTAQKGVRLLTTENADTAIKLAEEMNIENRKRQAVENEILHEAVEMAERIADASIFVLASDRWHPGVIGIAASRIVERYNRPAVLMCIDGDEARGSARSIPGLDLYSMLSKCRHLYKSFGGHRQAAGLTLDAGSLEDFTREINKVASEDMKDMDARQVLNADADITGINISVRDAKELKLMEPCGCGNPAPVFIKRNVRLTGQKRVGKRGEHLKLTAVENSAAYECIAFGREEAGPAAANKGTDILFSPKVNKWQGRENLQLVIKDIRDIEKQIGFLKGWYGSIKDLDADEAFMQTNKSGLTDNTDVQSIKDRWRFLSEVFSESSGNILLVNGFSDVVQAISALSLQPDVEVCFGRVGDYSNKKNYVVVHFNSVKGLENCTGNIYLLDGCVLPVQLEAAGKVKGGRPVLLTGKNRRCISKELRGVIPDRKALAGAYRLVENNGCIALEALIKLLAKRGISPATAMLAVEALAETNLIGLNETGLYLMQAPEKKVEILKSRPVKVISDFANTVENCSNAIKKQIFDI